MNSSGRGKGIAVYTKKEFRHNCDMNEENVSITKMDSEDIDVIAIYRGGRRKFERADKQTSKSNQLVKDYLSDRRHEYL